MSARLVLAADVYYSGPDSEEDPSKWILDLEITQGVNVSKKLFLVEKKLFDGTWSAPVFSRVASTSDLKKYRYSDPETDGGTYRNGYHYYLSTTAKSTHPSWDSANAAYNHARAHIRSIVGFDPDTTLTADLGLTVVGIVPERVSGTQYSMYPLDSCRFTGVGGVAPYAYSLEGDDTDSSIDSVSGSFIANNPGSCLVVVTDSFGTRVLVTVTIAEPAQPAAIEVFDV